MRYEKSCGAIVFREAEKSHEILLLKHKAGHWDFPKGHVEEGESEQQTALREVMEESGLVVKILDNGFRRVIHYSPYPGCVKDVVYFIARYESGELKIQTEEISGALWASPGEALEMISYQNARELLADALSYLSLDEHKA